MLYSRDSTQWERAWEREKESERGRVNVREQKPYVSYVVCLTYAVKCLNVHLRLFYLFAASNFGMLNARLDLVNSCILLEKGLSFHCAFSCNDFCMRAVLKLRLISRTKTSINHGSEERKLLSTAFKAATPRRITTMTTLARTKQHNAHVSKVAQSPVSKNLTDCNTWVKECCKL